MIAPLYNLPNEHKAHTKLLHISAFSFYDAACVISANIGVDEDHEEKILDKDVVKDKEYLD
jgi:hypothetical protein